jgi:cytochrome c oxidase subunit 4
MSSTENTQKGNGGGHVVSAQVLLRVWGALLVLTVVTVLVSLVNLGALNLPLALLIATVKAALVALYFMHLRYDRPVNALVLGAAVLFLAIFIGIALMDTIEYQGDLIPDYGHETETPVSDH